MFSSLKFNSLKCQSNGSSEKNKDICEDDDDDGASDHMYEKLQSFDNKQCKCHLDHIRKPSKPSKTLFNKRISKWRMECSNMKNLQNGSPPDDRNSRNNQEKRIRETFNLEQAESSRSKITTVSIERENGNLGITLRGGYHQNSDLSKPLIITYIKPDGPVAREGTIKPGDRLLAVDGVSIAGSSLNDAQTLLKQPSPTTLLTIEYDINIIHGVEQANGPLLVEIERKLSQQLGLTLFQNEGGIIIEKVKSGSLADRSGALHVGDEILAINSTRIGGTSIALEDVLKILDCEGPIVRLEILPSYAASCYSNYGTWRTRGSSLSGISLFKDHEIRKSRNSERCESQNVIDQDLGFLNSRCLNHSGNEIGLVHSETLHTLLIRENGSFGLEFADAPDGSVIINSVFPEGPAERSQCLHPGDRVLSLNHKSLNLNNLKAKDAQNLMDYNSKELMCSKLSLITEFDVLDTVIPSSGIFLVKLMNRGSAGLGITITASKTSGFIICEMKKGSIAYRAGSLIPGDRLLAINNVPLDHCSMEYAAHILYESKNVVTLKVQREASSAECLGCRKITYSVDLQRFGGPLGITIAGSEEPFQPITISGLTNGGLAEQSGVIHIGDEILAINNHSIYGEPLSKAHYLLQNSSDLVTLKLSRPLLPICRLPICQSPVFPSSIDSAVESWDSSHLDLATSPDYQKPLKDTKDAPKKNPSAKEQSQPVENNLSSTPKNIDKICMTNSTLGNDSNLSILDEITSENLKIKHELDLLTLKLDEKRISKLPENESQDFHACNVNDLRANKDSPKSIETINLDKNKNEEESNSFKKETEAIPIQQSTFGNVVANDFELNLDVRNSVQSNDFKQTEMENFHKTRTWPKNQYLGNECNHEYIRNEFQSSQLYEVTLYKDPIYEDFGFSVSDGLYERGVFINRIRRGGPADLSKILKPYDRILQVNDTYTQDFDCCLTVPLIASAGDCLVLLVARNFESTENDNIGHEKFPSHGILMHDSNSHIQDDLKRILV